MKKLKLVGLSAIFLCAHPAAFAQAAPQAAHAKKVSEAPAPFSFEPLDKWKAAVLAGDKAALMTFYTTTPPATAKTPQGDALDPSEEPAYWSSFRKQGLNHLDVKVLEVKNLQPGI